MSRVLVFGCLVILGLKGFSAADSARWISDRPDCGVDVTQRMIGVPVAPSMPKNTVAFRRRFVLPERPDAAPVRVTGLGFYRLEVNGTDVDPMRVLMPGWTNPGWRVLYDEYDVARLLKKGENEMRVLVAPGYSDDVNGWAWRWLRPKRVWLELAAGCERIVTDGSWEWTDDQPVLSASIYNGEVVDASRGTTARWRPVVAFDDPSVRLEKNEGPAVRLFDPRHPVRIIPCEHDRFVLDFGVNRAGLTEFSAKLPRGTRVTLRHAEEMIGQELDTRTQKHAAQTDIYLTAGTGEVETYRPRFTYHGYRYVEVSGVPPDQMKTENFTSWGVSADVREKATFSCSDETLNWLWDVARRSMRSNFMSYPTDCCMRNERTPCLMDSQVYEDAAFQAFDMQAFYSKWLFDAARYELAVDPAVGNNDNPDWAGDPFTLAERFLTYCAATNVALREYADLKCAAESFAARSPDGLWEKGFGDWCSPLSWGNFSPELVNSVMLCEVYRIMAKLAAIKGDSGDVRRFGDLRDRSRTAFFAKFYDPQAKAFGVGRAVEQILPLRFGLVPKEAEAGVVASLRRRIVETDKGHLAVGIYGNRYAGDVMMNHGLGDLWLECIRTTTWPGFGFMRASGATSLWEQWTRDGAMNSHNHAMFAGAVSCFFTHLAGIRPAADGYSRILAKPCFPKGLDALDVTMELPCGKVSVSWRRTPNGVDYHVNAPKGVDVIYDR